MSSKVIQVPGSIKIFLVSAFLLTLSCGLVYAAVQQNFRQSANDPQIQMARDAAYALQNGASAQSVIPQTSVDLDQSLNTWMTVYNENKEVVASSGKLDGSPAKVPSGVLEYTKNNIEDRVTWQPKPEVRQATVTVHYTGGYVTAGRSLKEIEVREKNLEKQVGAAWIVGIVGALVLSFVL